MFVPFEGDLENEPEKEYKEADKDGFAVIVEVRHPARGLCRVRQGGAMTAGARVELCFLLEIEKERKENM